MSKIYKIKDRDNGLFSNGSVNRFYSKEENRVVIQKWSKKGKEWTSDVLLKKHLLECIKLGGIPSSWEVMEFTQEPAKELNDWIDNEMLVKILKINHNKNENL